MKEDTHNIKSLTDNRFKTILFILRLGGIPMCKKSVTLVNCAYNEMLALCFYITVLSLILKLIINRDNLKETMAIIRALITVILIAWMHSFLRFRRFEFEHLIALTESFTWEEMPIRDINTGRLTKAGYVSIIAAPSKRIVLSLIAFQIVQSSVQILVNHDYIIPTWYPFDTSVSPIYEIINLSQFIAAIFIICIFIGFASLYAMLVNIASAQLEKLRLTLQAISQQNISSEQKIKYRRPEEAFRQMQKQLNKCIRHHQLIKRYMGALEDYLNVPLCGLLLLLMSGMCLAAFSFITDWGDAVHEAQALVLYWAFVFCTAIYCWCVDELTEESFKIRDAVFECDWVGTPIPFQRSLSIIICNASKEFTITAGKFVPVCNNTMMSMMNSSLSFFMFLLQMKDKSVEMEQEVQEL